METNEIFPVLPEVIKEEPTKEEKEKRLPTKVKVRRASNLRGDYYIVQYEGKYYRLPEKYVSDVGRQSFFFIDKKLIETLKEN